MTQVLGSVEPSPRTPGRRPRRRGPGLLCVLGAFLLIVAGLTLPAPSPAMAAAGDVIVPVGELAVTFVARECDAYDDIMANKARNNIQESLRDLGKDSVYDNGVPVSPGIEAPNDPDCTPLRGWKFQFGRGIQDKQESTNYLSTVTGPYATPITTAGPIPELDSDGVDTGRTLDGAVTIVLDEEEKARVQSGAQFWAEGGRTNETLPPSGEFGFGALRCSTDGFNGDNVEYLSFPAGARHVYCYYYAVTPPPAAGTIEVVKQLAPGSVGTQTFRYEGNISYDRPSENDPGRFQLTASDGAPGRTTFVRGAVTGEGVPPWTFQEQPLDGWELASEPTCTTELQSPWTYTAANGFAVTLRAGDDVVCTFVNQRELTGPLVLYKQTVNGVGSFDFDIDIPPPSPVDREETVDVTEENTLFEVASAPADFPGTYTATETLPQVSYGEWEVRDAFCNDEELDVDEDGDERSASFEVVAGEDLTCVVTNEFTSDGAIAINKETRNGTGRFEYGIAPASDDENSPPGAESYRLAATTTAEDTPVAAAPTGGSATPTNLRIGSRWQIQEYLPAATEDGFWRVVSVDCGPNDGELNLAAGNVEVTVTEENPEIDCDFVNEFVDTGTLDVVKNTSDDPDLRPDPAVIDYDCGDDQDGSFSVPAGEASGSLGETDTTGFVQCTVTEDETGAADGADVTTTATIAVDGGAAEPYTLGEEFLVNPGTSVVVRIANTLVAPSPSPTPTVSPPVPTPPVTPTPSPSPSSISPSSTTEPPDPGGGGGSGGGGGYLPDTGGPGLAIGLGGLVCLAVGGGLLLARRRRA